ncbi:MAG TPA: ATP-binding protein [Steroidobacteraceae bacterium]|nr:ATP-binding protein [Steroidobacteraceae bacterium]
MDSSRFSFAGLLALALGGALLAGVGLALLVSRVLANPWLAASAALALGLPLAVAAARALGKPWIRFLGALADGLASLKDGDFSLNLARPRGLPEADALARAYNGLGERFRAERQTLVQRELLLDTVIQATPLAIVLTNDAGQVIYANLAARRLFGAGRPLEGEGFNRLVEAADAALQEAIAGGRDTLFTMRVGEEAEIFHLSLRHFAMNARSHHLYLLKQLTRELNAQEVATWKKVIRVIAHELNNSLAPISSLAHSGRALAAAPDPAALERVFGTIAERAQHLHRFIDGYARFAKLPQPRPEAVAWAPLAEQLRATVGFALAAPLPEEAGWFDPAQIGQVLINLLKNAHESGSPPVAVTLAVTRGRGGFEIVVADRGTGMSQAVLEHALVPFYSTKPQGTGLGLTLSREIAEAHGGRLELIARDGGGTEVRLWLPAPRSPQPLDINPHAKESRRG